ncbi:MAG: hypothetical protein ABIP06_11290 [Pyrinomonadaceae bacterium]
MNLINDLDTEIAFAVLVEKKHYKKIESKDVLPLIGRLNKALERISQTDEDISEPILADNIHSKFAAL